MIVAIAFAAALLTTAIAIGVLAARQREMTRAHRIFLAIIRDMAHHAKLVNLQLEAHSEQIERVVLDGDWPGCATCRKESWAASSIRLDRRARPS